MKRIYRKSMCFAIGGVILMSACSGVFADNKIENTLQQQEVQMAYVVPLEFTGPVITRDDGEEYKMPSDDYALVGWYEDGDFAVRYYKETGEILCVFSKKAHLQEFVVPEKISSISSQFVTISDVIIDRFVIPAGVTQISEGSFNNFSCKEFAVDENNPNYCSVDGVLYTKDMKDMIAYPSLKEEKVYKMPEGVESCSGFRSLNNIEYIALPKSFNADLLPSQGLLGLDKLKGIYFQGKLPMIYAWELNKHVTLYKESAQKVTFHLNSNDGKVDLINMDDSKFTLSDAKGALKNALGIREKELDLRKYITSSQESYLYDYDNDGKVDLKDACEILKKSLGI